MTDGRTAEGGEAALGVAGAGMVRLGALRRFGELVRELGGDPDALLAAAQVDPAAFADHHAVVPYRTLVQLLERAAADLGCPDFGMRLAAMQAGSRIQGPLDVAMRNAEVLRDAFSYCAGHLHACNTAVQLSLEEDGAAKTVFLRFEILAAGAPRRAQTLEHALLLTQHNFLDLSGGRARAREVWFMHEPISPMAAYRANFGATVRFGQSKTGLVLARRDFDLPIPNGDPHLYEMATHFIEQRFPAAELALSTRVRVIIERLLLAGTCSAEAVAALLGLHPRTIQRRLRVEGESFETLKDSVRRDLALRYLNEPSIPLTRIAELLGYSETSVLSRSCHRWFGASPRQLRGRGAAAAKRHHAA